MDKYRIRKWINKLIAITVSKTMSWDKSQSRTDFWLRSKQ